MIRANIQRSSLESSQHSLGSNQGNRGNSQANQGNQGDSQANQDNQGDSQGNRHQHTRLAKMLTMKTLKQPSQSILKIEASCSGGSG